MKKTLIALAVLGVASVAQAQSNVTIYGAVDINYTKESHESTYMDERFNNRLGFMGQEALGGGLYATFQLEHRFKLHKGTSSSRGDFEGAANLGLKGNFGQIRFGRVNELSTETYRKIDPFEQYGVGGMFESPLRGNDGEGRLSNTARYDSPTFNGFKFGASYSVKGGEYYALYCDGYYGWNPSANNNGYALSATYTNGPAYVVANYNKAVNSNSSYNWNLGGAYAFGPAKISLGYEETRLKDSYDTEKVKNWIVGLTYNVGAGQVRASYNDGKYSDANESQKAKKYAIGYLHNLSKRTAVYADFSKTKVHDLYEYGSAVEPGESYNQFSVGITHKF